MTERETKPKEEVWLPDGFSEPGTFPYAFDGGTKLPEGKEYIIEEVEPGLYVVTNAYEGYWEFFPGRPICYIASDGKAYYPPLPQDS